MPRLMIISHGHPELSLGGAERASYAIHGLIRQGGLPGWDSVYVARAERKHIGHDGDFGAFRGKADEILAFPPEVDHFFQSSSHPGRLFSHLDELTERFRPDLVHIHHFTYWGTETVEYFRNRNIPVGVTLHEYMAMCHRFGQMVKVNGRLCTDASPGECAQCFPDVSSGLFFLRDELFRLQLGRATFLVSPSEFLARRFRDWSGGRLTFEVIENPRDLRLYAGADDEAECGTRPGGELRIGYFGQINPFKGVETLLDAAAILRHRGLPVSIRLFGSNLDVQDADFKERVKRKLDALDGMVDFHGPYHNAGVLDLMAGCDVVVVPSTWWENSPVVVQEALQAGVHVLASRIGGLEEKLKGHPRATLFQPGSPPALADRIQQLAAALPRPDRAAAAAEAVKAAARDWDALCALYQRALQSAPAPVAAAGRVKAATRRRGTR